MTHHDVLDRDQRLDAPAEETEVFVDFLATEFPDWHFEVDATTTSRGTTARWVARRDGHHPQTELSAGKLHRRLSDYEERVRARRIGDN